MSHKLQLHLLLGHISAKITANAAIGLCSLANHFSWPIHPLCLWTTGPARRKIHTFCNIAAGKSNSSLIQAQLSHPELSYSLAVRARWVESQQTLTVLPTAAVWDLIISGVRPIMTADRFYMQAKVFLLFQFPSSLKRLLIYIIINSLKDDNLQQLMRSFTEHIIFKLTGIKSLFQTM